MAQRLFCSFCLCIAAIACGQESPTKSATEEQARRRLEFSRLQPGNAE